MLRVQLINDYLGSIVLDKEDPIDINEVTKTLKRSEKYDGIVFEIVIELSFISEGRAFIKQSYEIGGGIDAEVFVNIYDRDPNNREWELYYTGQINYERYELDEDKVVITIEQTGFQRRLLNLSNTKVDLETQISENGIVLPPQNVQEILFHSKIIDKQYKAAPGSLEEYIQGGVNSLTIDRGGALGLEKDVGLMAYGQFDTNDAQLDDIEESFQTLSNFVTSDLDYATLINCNTDSEYTAVFTQELISKIGPNLVAQEDGNLNGIVNIHLKPKIIGTNEGGDIDICGNGTVGSWEVVAWMVIVNDLNEIKTVNRIGTWNTPGCGLYEREGEFEEHSIIINEDLDRGDSVYLFSTYRVWGTYKNVDLLERGYIYYSYGVEYGNNFIVDFKQSTTFEPTTVQCIMIHEAVERCVQRYTNQIECFRSPILGRTDIGYEEDGELALIAITNGNRIRSAEDKQVFASFNDLIEFINMVGCIGFSVEKDESGKSIVVLDKKERFFDKDTIAVSLGKVRGVKKVVAPERYFNKITIGYSGKIDIKQVNGVDEFNTIRNYTLPIFNTKNDLPISTAIRASGYQIENQRRLQITTKDSNQDDDLFCVSVVRTDDGGYRSKRTEDYEHFENINQSETGYNYDLTPGRAILKWSRIMASNLIRHKGIKQAVFSYGEGNYLAATKKLNEPEVRENNSIDLSEVEPIWDNEDYILKDVPLSRDQEKALSQNPRGVVQFEDRFGNLMEGFISTKGVEIDSNTGKGDFTLWRVYRK